MVKVLEGCGFLFNHDVLGIYIHTHLFYLVINRWVVVVLHLLKLPSDLHLVLFDLILHLSQMLVLLRLIVVI